jgi:hypothetical protein
MKYGKTIKNRRLNEYDEWLSSNREFDENVIKGEAIRDSIREKIRTKISTHLDETRNQTWCKCDTCTLIRLKAEDEKTISSLALIGLQYLLGENFNGVAALYYHSYLDEIK